MTDVALKIHNRWRKMPGRWRWTLLIGTGLLAFPVGSECGRWWAVGYLAAWNAVRIFILD